MKRLAIVLCFLFLSPFSRAMELDLYINTGPVIIEQNSFYCTAFNESPELEAKNVIIHLESGEMLDLTVHNSTGLMQNFTIDGILETDNEIEAGQSRSFQIEFPENGTWRYYSSEFYGQMAGASGIILVGYDDANKFYWNLFDLNQGLSQDISENNVGEIPSDYQPELFFINGTYHPFTLEDPQTLVSLSLGEEAIISVVNSGYMDHVLHFHGFHVEILSSQGQPERVGWSKDSIPLKSGEAMTFHLIADQAGIYPVHDHNLIAVTNVGFYPGGMLTRIEVSE